MYKLFVFRIRTVLFFVVVYICKFHWVSQEIAQVLKMVGLEGLQNLLLPKAKADQTFVSKLADILVKPNAEFEFHCGKLLHLPVLSNKSCSSTRLSDFGITCSQSGTNKMQKNAQK